MDTDNLRGSVDALAVSSSYFVASPERQKRSTVVLTDRRAEKGLAAVAAWLVVADASYCHLMRRSLPLCIFSSCIHRVSREKTAVEPVFVLHNLSHPPSSRRRRTISSASGLFEERKRRRGFGNRRKLSSRLSRRRCGRHVSLCLSQTHL